MYRVEINMFHISSDESTLVNDYETNDQFKDLEKSTMLAINHQ